jgi:tellurite resistance protein TehA-like permease
MIKALKLQKAVIAIILGVVALIIAQVMSSKHMQGSNYVLGLSGVLFIVGALIFLYPILFAKKVENEETKVELQPAAKEPNENQ